MQDGQTENKKSKTIINSLGFVIGFTIIFVLLGVLSASLGKFVREYSVLVNVIFGSVIILFGLNFISIVNIPILNKAKKINVNTKNLRFLSSILFGTAFGLGWTPCVGVFLGSALMMVANNVDTTKGVLMLVCFSMGLGIPFIISGMLINLLKTTFEFIKRNYKIINIISGVFLILMGILMAAGLMGRFLKIISI